jgi:hypothetical protein
MPTQRKTIKAMADGAALFDHGLLQAAKMRTTVRRYFEDNTVGTYIASAMDSVRRSRGMLWPELVELLDIARLKVEWSEPVFMGLDVEDRVFGTFEAFYAEMVEPWLGEWRKLTERYREFAGAKTPEESEQARKKGAADFMKRTEPLPMNQTPAEYGKKGGRGKKASDNITGFSPGGDRGTSASYLAARLKRDHPDVAAAVERGEYGSIRQAAKAAGIVRDPDPLSQLNRWWDRASKDQRGRFMSDNGLEYATERRAA